jgi:choline kinase
MSSTLENLSQFKSHWIIGNFEPSLLKADFEVMVRNDKKHNVFPRHFHKQATEYNVVISGKYKVEDTIYGNGDIFIIPPYKSSECECLIGGTMLCIKDKSIPKDKFMGSVLNICIPMGGRSSRFFNVPKPWIPVNGKTMIENVIDNLRPKREHRFIFFCLEEHKDIFKPLLEQYGHIIWIKDRVDGAAEAILLAKDLINNNDPLLISDCDQLIEMDLNKFYDNLFTSKLDASVLTVETEDPACSFVKVENGLVTESAEKKVISNISPCGKHLFKKGKYFVEAAERMIKKNDRTNGDFYITPIYNYIKKKVGIYPAEGWWDIGTPEHLKRYLER